MSWMNAFANLIGAGTTISGQRPVFNDSVRVDGTVEAEVIVVSKAGKIEGGIFYGDFSLEKGGKCQANEINTDKAFIDGELICKLLRSNKLVIGENAVITGGELLYEDLTIHTGAQLNGCTLTAMKFSSKGEIV